MKERAILLDALRGFAIILVVLGHAIQSSFVDYDNNPFFRIIYSFHMPLFMFLSGYVSYASFDGTINKLVRRFRSLIIPFLFGYLLLFYSTIYIQ